MPAPRARRTNIQPAQSSFVGRSGELAMLAQRVDEHRLVTLLGPPGVGKTRLLGQYAERRIADKRDPCDIWFCDLREAQSELDLAHLVARRLGTPLTARSPRERHEQLARLLDAGGPALFLLDNFEQLVGLAADTLGLWLAATRTARFVVTTRQRLGIAGEVLMDLEPLATHDAVELFGQRARAVRADFQADESLMVRLVTKLDRLPLAIELAAARMRLLDPREIVEDDRLLRIGGAARGSERAHTLWQAIEGSWAHLTDAERELLAQCSVFRGGFDRAAADGVLRAACGIVDGLQALRDKSLLQVIPPVESRPRARFDLLLSVRELAADKLAATGGAEETRARHRDHYLELAERCAEEVEAWSSREARERVLLELDNLLSIHRRAVEARDPATALRAAASLNPVLQIHAPAELRLRLLDDALALAEDSEADEELLARAIAGRAHALHVLGRGNESREAFTLASEIAERSGSIRLLGRVRGRFAGVLWEQSHNQRAREMAALALACHEQTGDHGWRGTTLSNIAFGLMLEGDLEAAYRYQEEALALHRLVGDRRREAVDLNNLANVEQDQGDLSRARDHYEQALALERGANDPAFEAAILGSLAVLDLEEGELERANERLDEALALARRLGNRYLEGVFLGHRGMRRELGSDPAGALADYDAAIAALGGTAPAGLAVALYGSMGALHAARGAQDAADRALVFAAQSSERQGEASARSAAVCAAEVALRLGRATVDAARAELAGARAILEDRRSFHLRFVSDRLARAIEAELARGEGRILEVGPDGVWFRWGSGDRVSLHRRAPLSRLLHAFVEQHLRARHHALGVEQLAERGWPGERIQPHAAQSRVHNALSMLRRAGLREALDRHEGGYRLDPGIAVVTRHEDRLSDA